MNFDKREKEIINILYSNYKLKFENACFSEGYIPKHIILDRTRNIHSYVIFICKEGEDYYSRYFKNKSNYSSDLIQILKTQYSQLDRPLFFITETEDKKLVLIEGNELRELLLSDIILLDELISQIIPLSIPVKDIISKIKAEL